MTMDWNKPFEVTNVSKGRIVVGALVLYDGDSKEVNPLLYSEKAIQTLERYYALGCIEATNDFVSEEEISNEYSVKEIKSIKNEHGDTRSHLVYDPNKIEKAVSTKPIDTGKAIAVSNLLEDDSVEYSDIDKIEAKEFLELQWKKMQSEVNKITNKRKLSFYLSIAKEWAVADKKIEILENRIAVL